MLMDQFRTLLLYYQHKMCTHKCWLDNTAEWQQCIRITTSFHNDLSTIEHHSQWQYMTKIERKVVTRSVDYIMWWIAGLWSSTADQVLKYTKYKYWSSTFIPSTNTSTHIKICSKVCMDIQSRLILNKQNKRLSPNHVSVQKSRWPYSMQSKFRMDKNKGAFPKSCLFKIQDSISSVNLECKI